MAVFALRKYLKNIRQDIFEAPEKMDRGRRAMPVQNYICNQKYNKRCYEQHRQRLRNMKSNIDNKNSRQATHLRTKAKKNALMEERIDQIETENRLLLQNIMRCEGGIDSANESIKYGHSLNNERRKRELQRITKQNHQILKRIQDSRPTYNHLAWEDQAKINDRILENICEFKPKKMLEDEKLISQQCAENFMVDYDEDYRQ